MDGLRYHELAERDHEIQTRTEQLELINDQLQHAIFHVEEGIRFIKF